MLGLVGVMRLMKPIIVTALMVAIVAAIVLLTARCGCVL